MATRERVSRLPAAAPGDGEVIDTPASVAIVSSRDTETEDETEEQSLVDRLRGVMASSPADKVRVKMSRRSKQSGRMEWCRDYTPHEFESGDLEAVRNEWGPGDYEFRIINSKGIAGRMLQTIAAPSTVAAAAPVAQQSSELASVLQSMQETQARMLEALTQRPDPAAAMMQSLHLMTAIREAMGTGAAAAPAQPVINPMVQLKEMMEVMRGLKETARELNGDEPRGDPSDPMSMIPGVLQIVQTALANKQPQTVDMQAMPPIQLPHSMQQNAQANPQPAQTTEPEPMPATPQSPEDLIILGVIEDLCQMAADAKPPADGGAFIHENLPDQLLPYLSSRYWFEAVAMRFPIIKPHEAWLRLAKAEADKLFALDEAADD